MNAETISDLYSVSAQELSNSNAKYILVEGRKERKGGGRERERKRGWRAGLNTKSTVQL